MVMDKIILNNLIALLEECLYNGDKDLGSLMAWFLATRNEIEEELVYDRLEQESLIVDC